MYGLGSVEPDIDPDLLLTVPDAYSYMVQSSSAMMTWSNPVGGVRPKANLGVNPRLALIVLKMGARLTRPASKRTLMPVENALIGKLYGATSLITPAEPRLRTGMMLIFLGLLLPRSDRSLRSSGRLTASFGIPTWLHDTGFWFRTNARPAEYKCCR